MKPMIDLSLNPDTNIFLKILKEADADALFALVDANREHLRQFLGWLDSNTSRLDSISFINGETSKLQRLEGAGRLHDKFVENKNRISAKGAGHVAPLRP